MLPENVNGGIGTFSVVLLVLMTNEEACAVEISPTAAIAPNVSLRVLDSFIVFPLSSFSGFGYHTSIPCANIRCMIVISLLPDPCILKCDFRLFAYKH